VTGSQSSAAMKMKKKREAKKAKKALQQQESGDAPKKEAARPSTNGVPAAPAAEVEYSSDPEKNKKAKKIKGVSVKQIMGSNNIKLRRLGKPRLGYCYVALCSATGSLGCRQA